MGVQHPGGHILSVIAVTSSLYPFSATQLIQDGSSSKARMSLVRSDKSKCGSKSSEASPCEGSGSS